MYSSSYPTPFRADDAAFLSWRTILGARRNRLLTDLAYAICPAHPFRQDTVTVREADIAIFPGQSLIAFSMPDVAQDRFFFCDQDGLRFETLFVGTNEQIYECCIQGELKMTPKSLRQYVRFFFHFVRSGIGAFHIAETVADLPWKPRTRKAVKQEVADRLMPLTWHGLQENGLYRYSATVVFQRALFATDILVASRDLRAVTVEPGELAGDYIRGEVVLANEEMLIPDLPVIRLPGY